jgi:hypothetical protein
VTAAGDGATRGSLEQYLARTWVDPRVREAHPGYVAVLVAASGLRPGPSSAHSEALLCDAETLTAQRLDGREPHGLPEVAAWRAAYLGFGVKPREARSSVESLLRRAAAGLPRIDRLTDVYNAVSVRHLLPLGGEDLTGYRGPGRGARRRLTDRDVRGAHDRRLIPIADLAGSGRTGQQGRGPRSSRRGTHD